MVGAYSSESLKGTRVTPLVPEKFLPFTLGLLNSVVATLGVLPLLAETALM